MSELKQIKRHHEQQLKHMDKKLAMYQIHPDDVDWLIKRIEQLEEERNEWLTEVHKWQRFYKESEESHLETKELLKKYREIYRKLKNAVKNEKYICHKKCQYVIPTHVIEEFIISLRILEGNEQ